MKLTLFLSLCIISALFAQQRIMTADSAHTDSTKIDSLLFSHADTLGLRMTYPHPGIPKNIITIPKMPQSPLEIDTRESSYYTPRNVQDKLDQIMNRPRSDSFVPVLAMAAFAASVAVRQLEVEKLFELEAEDYLVPQEEFGILQQLWIESPQTISELYRLSGLQKAQTAEILQQRISSLADKNLIKTRGQGENNILFFPAQKITKVKELFKIALADFERSDEEIEQLKTFYDKLLLINSDSD